MSRWYSKSKGKIPKKIYIQQSVGSLFGPYFSKTACPDGYVSIEYLLDEETGDFLRNPPLVPRIKGAKKKLDI